MRSPGKTLATASSRVQDPTAGTVLAAPAGGQAEIVLNFFNDSPDVAGFYLETEGLDGDWVQGSGLAHEAMAPASGGGTLTLTLAPPRNAALGDYDFRVRLVSGGVPIGAETPLTLRVDPGLALVAAEPAREPREDSLLAESEAAARKTPVKRPQKAVPIPPVEIPREEAVRETVPEIAEAAPPPLKPPVQEPPPVISQPVIRAPEPQKPAPPPPRPTRPAPPPEPVWENPVLVDMSRSHEDDAEEPEDEPPFAVQERSVLDPPEGIYLTLRPGETLLLRFPFTNTGTRERTYVLDEDRSLPSDWFTLVRDQVNLTRNGSGEVSLRLTPPLSASPGDYPFAVTIGPQGDTLTTRVLTMTVSATPAVKMTAKEAKVTVGPFASAMDFDLSVESVGNADTAFRVAVKAPPVKQGEENKRERGSDVIYETAQWRYLFDREVDNLASPSAGRPPRPVALRLRMQRRGPWWFGLRETHTVTAAAVPVTDPTNGGKLENAVELTAVRRRFLPFPAPFALLLLIPLLILVVVKASYLRVTNGYVSDNVYYILGSDDGSKGMTAQLRWDAPFFAFVNVSATENGNTDVYWFRHGGLLDTVKNPGYGLEKTYEVTRRKITARFVPLKTDGKLQITEGDLDYQHRTDVPLARVQQGVEKVGEDNVPVQSSTYELPVPRGKTVALNLLNTTPRSSSANIQFWLVQKPDADFFTVLDTRPNDQIAPMAATAPIKVRASGGSVSNTQELTLVTTDGGNQIVHIRLKAQ